MQPDQQFKRWKAAFLNFVRMKLPALIPQLVLHQSRAVIHTKSQDIIQTLPLTCAGDNRRTRQALDMVSASQPDRGAASWHSLCDRLDSQSITLTMRLARQLIRVQRPDESLSDFVHNMRQAHDDMNESCLMDDGHVVMPEQFLSIFMLVGMSLEGPYGQAKQYIVNAFDPTLSLSASEVSQQILRQAYHLDTSAAVVDSTAPLVSAFFAGSWPHRRRSFARGGGKPPVPEDHPLKQFNVRCNCCGGEDHRGFDYKATAAKVIKWQRHKIVVLHNYFNRPKTATTHLSDVTEITATDPPLDIPSKPEG
jgi:hypothetical protein